MQQSRPSKSGSLYTSAAGRPPWNQCYLSVRNSYLQMSEAKDGHPYREVVRSCIENALQYDTDDPCKFKIELKRDTPIFLKAESEDVVKEWIQVLMWKHSAPAGPPPHQRSKACIIL